MIKIYAFSLFMLLVLPATSQRFQLGMKAGFNISSTSLQDEGVEVGYLPGYQFGLSAMLGEQFYFQPELLYIRKGMQVDSTATADYYRFKNTYWEFPLMLNYGAGREKVRIFLNFGPFVSYWAHGRVIENIKGERTAYAYVFDDNLEDGSKDHRWDYGFNTGGGLGLKIRSGWLYIEGRYHYGFSDIRTVKEADVDYKPVRNRTISGTLSYLYQF